MAVSDALTRLRELAEHRHRDPLVSIQEATEFLTADDPAVAAAAAQVVGLAQHELGRLNDAVESYRRALAVAEAHQLADAEATARANMATALLAQGDAVGAEREIAAAWRRSSPLSRGIVALRHGTVLLRTGRMNEALAVFDQAQRWLEDFHDGYLALVHLNRGVLHVYQGNQVAAVEDLVRAEEISRQRNLPVLVAMATHNLAFLFGRAGRLPDALAAFSRAREAYGELGNKERLLAVLEADRCPVLLLAGLVTEALAATQSAVDVLVTVGDRAELMETRLLLARALLAAGDYPAAALEATKAAEGFRSASWYPWAALAHYVALQAEILDNQDRTVPNVDVADLLNRCRGIAAELETEGWPVEAVHVHTFAGRLALALGRQAVARAELTGAAAARRRGTADLRAQAWHADALLRLAEGDRSGAKRALARGMKVVDDHRASLGATELRVHAAGHGADLARLGTRLALEDERAVEVFRWAERWRAGALRRRAVRPPDDERLAHDLTELRQAQDELRAARLAPASGHRGDGSADPAQASLQARIGDLERSIRSRTLEARDDAVATGRVDVAAIRSVLGDRCLVEYVAFEGHLHAVVITKHRVRLLKLGSPAIAQEKQYLLFAIRRLMATPMSRAASQTLAATAARLDQMLIGPLGLAPDSPLILVATGPLHGIPWSCLPGLRGRPTTVAPSAAAWVGQAASDRTGGRPGRSQPAVTLVAGPQLPGADAEVRQLGELYPGARLLCGPDATAAAVVAAVEDAGVVHLAAHGCFRADNPLFSSVLLADGPITVYELERLRLAPRSVVLASCEAAVSAVLVGDELLGTAAALIGLGVRDVIAPVMRVPDGTTKPFMVALHQEMRQGRSPAVALAHAARDQDQAVAAAFICIGCDDAVPSG